MPRKTASHTPERSPVLLARSYRLSCSLLPEISGEKLVFGIQKGQIETFLTQRGFTNVVETDARQLESLYCAGPNAGRRVADAYAIAHAET
jgi:hypothetical protein